MTTTRTLQAATLALCLVTADVVGQVLLYVAPNGNDAWSGRRTTPNAARTDGPFATLTHARDAIRALRHGGPIDQAVTVTVRGGQYFVTETLVFTAEDSGSQTCPVTFRAQPGETAVLSGARPVRGWKPYKGAIIVASLADQGVTQFRFRQLFLRGRRQTLARYPNRDPLHPQTGGFLYVDTPSYREKTAFHFDRGEIPLDEWSDTGQAEVNIFPYNCWDHNIIRVRRFDPETREVWLRYPVAGTINEGNRYFVRNVLDALDAPGEWYVDWGTGELYVYPPDGAIADDEVVVPVVENIVALSGTAANPVRHLTIQGFTLAYAEQDAVVLEGAEHCHIIGNTITNIGGIGINTGYLRNAKKGIGNRWVKGGRTRTPIHSGDRSLLCSTPCTDCRIAGNDIDSTGGDGIVLVGARNVADNNHVYRTGLFDKVCAGVTVYGDGNVMSHNEIHDVPRDGIFINGARNTAEYNAIRHTMLCTADNSAIALRQHNVARAVRDRGNVIRFNKILDTVGYGSYPHCQHPPQGYGSPYCSWGIYLDGSICGVTVYGNVIARSGANSIFIQFGGENIVENNIFVEPAETVIQHSCMVHFGWFMHTDNEGMFPEPPNEIKRNIFHYNGKDRPLYGTSLWGHPEWNEKQAVFEHNTIWANGRPVRVALDSKRTYASFEAWQATGRERGSVVADPLFVNPSQDDYRLKPESPAFRAGFRNINAEIDKMGAYESAERATWPLRELKLARETPLVFAYAKPPRPIVDGFELTPEGYPPAQARTTVEGNASIVVTRKVFSSGAQSLRFTDAPRLKHDFNPHLTYALNDPDGEYAFSVDAMNSADAPAQWYMEFRDWHEKLFIGPTFAGFPDGTLTAGGRFGSPGDVLGVVPNGTWFTITIAFESGADAPKTYTLRLTVKGEAEKVFADLPYADAAFASPNWFGISSMSTDRTVFFADNMVLGPAKAEQLLNAATAPSIRGTTMKPRPAAKMRNPDMLAFHWAFDEPSSYRLADSSGNGLDGDLGGVTRAKGDFGRALYFDGSGAIVELEDHPLVQFGTSGFTVECWLCPTMLSIDSPHQRRRLLDKGLWPATWWNVDITSDGRIRMEMADSSKQTGTSESDGAISENNWTHLAIVVDRTRFTTAYYLNGRLDSTKPLPKTFTGNLDLAGKSFTSGSWQPYIGLMDELKVYKRVFGSREALTSFTAAKARYRSTGFVAEPED